MYEELRPNVTLSLQAWSMLEAIREACYGLTLAHFLTSNPQVIRKGVLSLAPDFKEDWLRATVGGQQVTVSVADAHMTAFSETLSRFYSFGTAVRVLGAY